MALKNRSVATIDAPEFLNLEPYNPSISTCEIKVFYLGKNRNGSFIDKNTAIQMANSLPGTPIVAAYREEIQDFGDHGHIMHIEDGEIKFSVKTRPYGFVAPDAEVWFQKFIDTDEFNNEIEREYLMTTGYLWTGQYEEIKKALKEGQPQSMELDDETLDGHWATDNNSGLEFFIINDAMFSKLCILGDDVEPCFEGASVTSPEVSKNFSKDEEFSRTLFTMMNELKDALSKNEGGSSMIEEEKLEAQEAETLFEATEEVVEEPAAEFEEAEVNAEPEFAEAKEDKKDEEDPEDDEEDKKKEDEDYKKKPGGCHELEESESEEAPQMYSEEEYNALQSQLESLQAEIEALREFKLIAENQQKDELIARYFMLSDEDKAEIIAHKEEYSYDEIEAKLAVLYVTKNVDFSTVDGQVETKVEEEDVITTFSLDGEVEGIVSPLQEALRRTRR